MIKWGCFQPLIGGMALGAFEAIGTKPEFILSYEGFQYNEQHLRNYWPDVPYFILNGDGVFIDDADKKKFDELNVDIDIMIAVPICSGLSMLNSCKDGEKARGADAAQNDNMYNVTTWILKNISPKTYIFENAPNLFTKTGDGVNEKLFSIAQENGFAYSLMKTNTYLHGIPQHRQRTFCFFWNGPKSPIMNFVKTEAPPLAEFLDNISDDATHYDEMVFGNLTDDWAYKYLIDKHGENFRDDVAKGKFKTFAHYLDANALHDECKKFCEDNELEYGVKIINHILKKKDMNMGFWDSTLAFAYEATNAIIAKNMHRIVHHHEDRFLTVRELLSLMGMPEDFTLIDPKKTINHISQNVPVKTARDWVKECIKYCEDKLILSKSVYVKQNNISETTEIIRIPKPQTELTDIF